MHLICLTLACILSAQVESQGIGGSTGEPQNRFGGSSGSASATDPFSGSAAGRTYPPAPVDARRTEAPPWKAESAQPDPSTQSDPSSQPALATPTAAAAPTDAATPPAQPPDPAKQSKIYSDLPAGARWGLMTTDPAARAGAADRSAQPTPPPSPATKTDIYSDLPAGARWGLMTTDPAARGGAAGGSAGSPVAAPADGGIPATDPSRRILPPRPEVPRVTVRQLIDEALAPPVEAPLSGRPLTLLDALSAARDRAERLATTHAYWQSVVTAAEYRVARDLVDQLGRISVPAADAPALGLAQNRAQTAADAARLAALEAQHRLAEAARLSPGAPLPLPADRPHFGTYRTRFDEIFSARVPAGRLRLLHRTMTIRLEVIEVRALAVQAAEDVLVARNDAYAIGQGDLLSLVAAADDLSGQRRAFLQALGHYNHDIADYALAIAPLETTGRALVSTLIELERQPSGRDTGQIPIRSDVEPAAFLQDLPGESGQTGRPALLPPLTEPTLAPPRDLSAAPRPHEPTSAPPQEGSSVEPAAAAPEAADSPAESTWPPPSPEAVESESAAAGEPTESEAEPAVEQPAGASAEPARPLVPVEPVPSGPILRIANRFPADSPVPFAPVRLYSALVDARPAVQAKHLATALHWNRAEDDPGQPIELADCLDGRKGAEAHAVIDAYWVARQQAAVYQVHLDRVTLLAELVPIALERTAEASGAEAMLRLHLARLSADADVLESRTRRLEAQFELTRIAGRPLESAWLLPSTPPHAGAYRLRLDVQPASLIESWPLRRLAVTIPALAENFTRRAAAVVEADVDRAEVTAAYQAGRPDVEAVLEAIDRQTDETLGFLDTVTAYNLSIADYVQAVLPPAIPGDQLVATLVVRR